MKKYPIGIQDFKKLRTENYVYADKTGYLRDLVRAGSHYFLSRPRRFGKSLFISTLEHYFLGNKALFKGLEIDDDSDWECFPVIRLSFGSTDFRQLGLRKSIGLLLQDAAERYGEKLEEETVGRQFRELILKLSAEKQVVVLIDEYDKPIIEFLDGPERHRAQENRLILKEFYSVVKDLDRHLRFFFLTGVSKFSKVSVFSDLNHLNDLSGSKQFSALAGYTQSELETVFSEEISEKAAARGLSEADFLAEIKRWYNGYRWHETAETVYNPFSVLNFMLKDSFANYWFETGTPTFLLKLIENEQLFNFENIETDEALINSFEIENLHPLALLFQTGYLTITGSEFPGVYTLNYPNKEVGDSMNQYLLRRYSATASPKSLAAKIARLFQNEELENLQELLNTLLAQIPYDLFKAKEELYYQAVFYLALRLTGYFIETEVKTNKGRIDALVKTDRAIYILEFKIDETAKAALQQIRDKKYYEKYRQDGRKIFLLGISCRDKEVSEVLWEIV